MEILSAHLKRGRQVISIFPSTKNKNAYVVSITTRYHEVCSPSCKKLTPKSTLCNTLSKLCEYGWGGLRIRVLGSVNQNGASQ